MQGKSDMAGAEPDRVLEISALAGGLAHEIRNPLSTLLVNLKLLEEDLKSGLDERSETLRRARLRIGIVRDEAERLQRLLDEFLLAVGPVGLRKSTADMNAVIRRLVDFYGPEAQRNKIDLRPLYAAEPAWCELDMQVFQQAILNLLVNAQQAMPNGGEIFLRTAGDGDDIVVEVIDTGEGMPPDVAGKALKPFFSTKPRGSGLGLPMASRIVSAHGGTLQFESERGKGTRFVIRVPAVEKP